MIYTQFQDPRIAKWQGRLARVPRWGWIAFFVGIMVPVIVLAAGIIAVSLVTGALVMAAVLLVSTALALVQRLLHRRRPRLDDGRRNVKIVVHSARVIDP